MNRFSIKLYLIAIVASLSALPLNVMQQPDYLQIAQESSAVQSPLATFFSSEDHGASTAQELIKTYSRKKLLKILTTQDDNGSTLIHRAAKYRRYGFINALRKANIKPEDLKKAVTLKTEVGTPLEMAVAFGDVKTVRALLKAGADANQQTGKHNTQYPVLLRAAFRDQVPEITKMLLRHGADPRLALEHPLITIIAPKMRALLTTHLVNRSPQQ